MLTKALLVNQVEEFLTELKYNEKADNTIKKYAGNLNCFFNWLDDETEITKDLMLNFKKHLIDSGFKTSTINSYIVTVNKYLKWLGYKELVVKQLKQQRKNSLEDVLNVKEYKRLLRFAKAAGKIKIYYIMKVFAMTGIRVSELKYITVENLKSNYIKVTNKGKEREIIIRQDLLRELRKYCRENGIYSGYIFPGKVKGKLISESTIWRNMRKIGGQARVKLSKIHAHSFRHLFAKMYLQEYPNNITELADILGHNSLETTRIYTRSTSQEKREKLEKIKY